MREMRAFGVGMALCLLGNLAQAALPDPVQFGIAVERGDTQAVKRWLDEGLDPNYEADRFGSGLMIAAWNGDIPMMKLFVERGADPLAVNRVGEQPLLLAAWNGHLDAVKWLLAHGAALKRPDLQWTALHYATFNGKDEVAAYLIEQKADVDARSPNRSTALLLAAREGQEHIAQKLLAAGADPRAQNDWGDGPLSMAMRHERLRLAKLLASAEEFAAAVKAPPGIFGEAVRSVAAPGAVDELLAQLRRAQAEKRPAAEVERLRKQFFAAVDELRASEKESVQLSRRQQKRSPGKLLITAQRGKSGERAELLAADMAPAVDRESGSSRAKAPAAERAGRRDSSPTASSPAEVAALTRELRAASAQGRPTDELQRRLDEAIGRLGK